MACIAVAGILAVFLANALIIYALLAVRPF
jgi:hypothetical protein